MLPGMTPRVVTMAKLAVTAHGCPFPEAIVAFGNELVTHPGVFTARGGRVPPSVLRVGGVFYSRDRISRRSHSRPKVTLPRSDDAPAKKDIEFS